MRTSELMKEYMKHPDRDAPPCGWQRLVWHAADLVRMAISERNTAKGVHRETNPAYTQEELFVTSDEEIIHH